MYSATKVRVFALELHLQLRVLLAVQCLHVPYVLRTLSLGRCTLNPLVSSFLPTITPTCARGFNAFFPGSQYAVHGLPNVTTSDKFDTDPVSISGGDMCFELALQALRFNTNDAYSTASPQNKMQWEVTVEQNASRHVKHCLVHSFSLSVGRLVLSFADLAFHARSFAEQANVRVPLSVVGAQYMNPAIEPLLKIREKMLELLCRLHLVLRQEHAYVVRGVVDKIYEVAVPRRYRGVLSPFMSLPITPTILSIGVCLPVTFLDWLFLLYFP